MGQLSVRQCVSFPVHQYFSLLICSPMGAVAVCPSQRRDDATFGGEWRVPMPSGERNAQSVGHFAPTDCRGAAPCTDRLLAALKPAGGPNSAHDGCAASSARHLSCWRCAVAPLREIKRAQSGTNHNCAPQEVIDFNDLKPNEYNFSAA